MEHSRLPLSSGLLHKLSPPPEALMPISSCSSSRSQVPPPPGSPLCFCNTLPTPLLGYLRMALSPLDCEPQEGRARPVLVTTVSPVQDQTQSRASETMRGMKD